MPQMMHLKWRLVLTAGLFVLGPPLVRADLINFAGLTAKSPEAIIPNGYDGFTWNNFNALNTKTDANVLPSGYGHADTDSHSPNVAFNVYGQPASMTRKHPFSFYGGFFTGAWRDDLTIDVSGYRDGVLLYDKQFQVNSTAYTFESFDFTGIDELDFSSTGGIVHGYVPGKPLSHPPLTQFAMDDLLYVRDPGAATPDDAGLGAGPFVQGGPALAGPAPEPAGFVLCGLGASVGCLGAWLRGRRKKVLPAA
jgi:hypothetical protein